MEKCNGFRKKMVNSLHNPKKSTNFAGGNGLALKQVNTLAYEKAITYIPIASRIYGVHE
jgi:hypothetical protein